MQHTAAATLYSILTRLILYMLYIKPRPPLIYITIRGTLFVRNFARGIIIVDANYVPVYTYEFKASGGKATAAHLRVSKFQFSPDWDFHFNELKALGARSLSL